MNISLVYTRDSHKFTPEGPIITSLEGGFHRRWFVDCLSVLLLVVLVQKFAMDLKGRGVEWSAMKHPFDFGGDLDHDLASGICFNDSAQPVH